MVLTLANRQQSATSEVGMSKANLEHVFPQKATAEAWSNRTDLEPLAWNLGNKLNRKAQNKSFAETCASCSSKSEPVMTKQVLTFETWDPAAIAARATEIGKQVALVWPAV